MNNKIAIIMTGLNHSGKTFLAQKIKEKYSEYCILDGDAIRIFASQQFPDLYMKAKEKQELGETTQIIDFGTHNLNHFYLKNMIGFAIANGLIPILSSSNSWKKLRVRYKEYLSIFGYKTLLIYVNPGDDVIQERIKNGGIAHKNKLIYKRGFEGNLEWQKGFYETPSSSEADYFIETDGNLDIFFAQLSAIIHA